MKSLFLSLSLGLLLLATACLIFVQASPASSTSTSSSSPVQLEQAHPAKDTIELGNVAWLRDYDSARRLAAKTGKPLFIMFQEVPGCMNCQRFGRGVMSNPLFVDAIETEFVPLCVFNNHPGKDAETLRKFREPAWNNPVIRIIDPQTEADITARMGSFHPKEVAHGMVDALRATKKEIPPYLQLLQQQLHATYGQVEEAVFPMYCFWSGELKLGQLNGVVETTPGFMHGREVVKVQFDRSQTSYQDLLTDATACQAVEGAYATSSQQGSVAREVFDERSVKEVGGFRMDREPKYYLFHTAYKHIPMLPLQRIRVNRALYDRKNPQVYLSPSQIALYAQIDKGQLPDYTDSKDLVDDWKDVHQRLKGE